MPKRARKAVETARCCWVCGKLGGAGFSTALRLAGYDVPRDQIGYAHPGCMRYAQRRENRRLAKSVKPVTPPDKAGG